MERDQLTKKQINEGVEAFLDKFHAIRKKKGVGAWVTTHEALGFVTEEYHELSDAVRSNRLNDVEAELMDVAICSLWAIVSIRAGSITK